MYERMFPHGKNLLTKAALALVIVLISFAVGQACEFPDEHSVSLKSAIINGTDITQGRTIKVSPGSSLSGAIKVDGHHAGRWRGSEVVAATPNWKWGEFTSNSQTYTELMLANDHSYAYTLPAGLTAPTTPGTYYIGIFNSSVDTAQHLMSCDRLSSRRSTDYFWDTENAGDPAALDVANWPSEVWEQAVTGDAVEGFSFCRQSLCGPGYYGAAAVRLVVPEVMELESLGDTYVSSGKGFPWVGWKLKAEKYINFGGRAELSVVRGIQGHDDDFGGWHGALIQFDLSGIPEGAEILGAELFLYHGNRWGEPVSLHRMNQGWKEMEASWFEPCKGCDPWWPGWDEEGGNYEKGLTDSRKVNYRGWFAWDVLKDVKLFLGETSNHGWFLKSASSAGSDLTSTEFYSKEATDKDLVPFLRVRFSMPPPEVSFSAQPQSVLLGRSSTLSWDVKYAQEAKIEPKVGSDNVVPSRGSVVVTPVGTSTYTLTATGKGGTTSQSVTITVLQPPTVTLSFSAGSIKFGETATLTWSATNASSCSIDNGIGNVATSGSTTVSPPQTMTYTITAVGPGGWATAVATVTVTYPIPTVSLSASPASIVSGQSSLLSWTSIYANTCSIDNGISVAPNGTMTVSPTRDTTYIITATGPGGTATAQVLVIVTGKVEPQPDGTFGQRYQDLVPADATLHSYDPKRFSLITGQVRNVGGSPASNVSINVLGHSEYGTAKTDSQGRFSIPAEGGGILTLIYGKEGLIPAQRQVNVPWNDIAIVETIVMIPQDQGSTTLTFDGNPATVVTHRSSVVTDDRGSRSATVVFTGDNRAYSLDASGQVIQELTTLTTRATEFATEESMPAKLPPNSAYTYCVELSVDGAQRVRFDKPVTLWVDNFLGFNVGEIVPVGFYDRDRGVWVPSDNGVVVRLLDTDGDGVVDALDANGDGLPDDLNGNGSFKDEVAGLGDPQKYLPGSTFWRVQIMHFTPIDCNWPWLAPADAIYPNPQGVPDFDQQKKEEDDCKETMNSFVEGRSRVFHEDIPIPGTGMTLHYASNRVKGYKYGITVPASGDAVPSSLTRIIVRLQVAGQSFEENLSPLPRQKAQFVWNGLDHLGKSVIGPANANISIGFVYPAIMLKPGDFRRAFAQPGTEATGIRGRPECIFWSGTTIVINAGSQGGVIAEGWTISHHHSLSPIDPAILYKGDGTVDRNTLGLIIETVAGNGGFGYSGDGGPAIQAQLYSPTDVAVDSAGNLFIADGMNNVIRKVDAKGMITTVAGNGVAGYRGDGGPATQANLRFGNWGGIAVDPSGNLYIADSENDCIRKVDTNGIITTIVASGPASGWETAGFSGDGGPATQAQLRTPKAVAIDASGNLYIADSDNNRIRKVDTNGIITTIAGIGPNYSSCPADPGGLPKPAIQAQLCNPRKLSFDYVGNLYIAGVYYNRIYKVDSQGVITTVAGNGSAGYNQDWVPAIQAQLSWPSGVATDNSGNLYIADFANDRIRKVDVNGVISTVAGKGTPGYSGDGGLALTAQLYRPNAVARDPKGNVYISDTVNSRIRKVSTPSGSFPGLASGDLIFTEEAGVGYVMNAPGRHKTTIDLYTGRTLYSFDYDQNKKLISITDRFDNKTLITRNENGTPASITSPDGMATILTIDSSNYLTRITYPDATFYSFEYTPDGLLTAKVEPKGNRFEQTFDPIGRLTDVIDQEGGHWNYSRQAYENGDILVQRQSAEGNVVSYLDHTDSTGAYSSIITNPSASKTTFTRSADSLRTHKSLSCGMDLDFQYDVDSQYKFLYVKEMSESTPSGLKKNTLREKTYQDTNSDETPDLITEKVTVNSKATTLLTDTIQSQKTVNSPKGRAITTFYDPATLLANKLTIPGLSDINFGYDSRGRLTLIKTDTRQTALAYDAQGNLSSIIDPEDHTTNYSYDLGGRITGILRPDGSSIRFTYDTNGNIIVLTNPSTISHGFGYNQVNRNTTYQTPLSGNYSYLYDRDRRPIQVNFPSGKQIKFTYDKDQLHQAETPEGSITLNYLCGSKVGSVAKGAESIQYGYDGSLVISEALAGTINQTLSYSYNNDFRLTRLSYAGGSVPYSYDDDGLLTQAGDYTISRNAGNALPEIVTGGALNIIRTFNGYAEIAHQDFTINGLSLTSWDLTRDNAGRITSKTETINGVPSTYLYTYDSMGRLLTVTQDGSLVEEYRYGPDGTRIYEMNGLRGLSGRDYTYDTEDHLLSAGNTTYHYDADGFLITKTKGSNISRYNYSSRGELLSVSLPDGRFIEYVYDPLGRRIGKKIGGVITEKYLWQGLTRLLALYDGADNLLMRFEYAEGRMPVAMTKAGTSYYLTYDQVGSLRVVADATGNVVKRIDYDSFGNIINDTNSAFGMPFGFAAGLYDRATGLVKFGLRDYDPDTGRWAAKDPIFFSGGDPNLYGYVLNDPINLIDPSGLLIPPWHFIITYEIASYFGYGVLSSLQMAWNVMREDPIFPDKATDAANIHAMAGELPLGRYQTQAEALAAANNNIQNGPLFSALHTGQDYPGHFGESMQTFGLNWLTFKHLMNDILPDLDTLDQAYQNTFNILSRRGPCR